MWSCCRSGDRTLSEWSSSNLPLPQVLQDLLPREDEQIGYQELAGLVIALVTFGRLCHGQLVTAWQDNQGVLHAVLSGGGVAAEINAVVGQLWLYVSGADMSLWLGRVASAVCLTSPGHRLSVCHSVNAYSEVAPARFCSKSNCNVFIL